MDIPDFSWVKKYISRGFFIALCLIALVLSAKELEKPKAWIIALFAFVAFLVVFFFYKPKKEAQELDSNEWFDLILTHLDNASGAQIYLRTFMHPDYFQSKHRDALLKIMEAIVKQIREHSGTFRIVAYAGTTPNAKSALEWVRTELIRNSDPHLADDLIAKCIKVIDAQPHPNSSTVYLIDHQLLIYNYIHDGSDPSYHCLDLPRSVIPRLLEAGLEKLFASR
jgi:hypothetical protein